MAEQEMANAQSMKCQMPSSMKGHAVLQCLLPMPQCLLKFGTFAVFFAVPKAIASAKLTCPGACVAKLVLLTFMALSSHRWSRGPDFLCFGGLQWRALH